MKQIEVLIQELSNLKTKITYLEQVANDCRDHEASLEESEEARTQRDYDRMIADNV